MRRSSSRDLVRAQLYGSRDLARMFIYRSRDRYATPDPGVRCGLWIV